MYTKLESELIDKLASEDDRHKLRMRLDMVRENFAQSSPFINAANSDYTDHSVKHVHHVQGVLYRIIINNESLSLSIEELYLLCLVTYFHDWGNIVDRKEHKRFAFTYYNQVFNANLRIHGEANAINSITMAHSGSDDTLLKVDEDSYIFDRKIRTRLLAALLRLSDELAESKSRTSVDHMNRPDIDKTSILHHFYAFAIEIQPDIHRRRIAATYNIFVRNDSNGLNVTNIGVNATIQFPEFMEFLFQRIDKMNGERKYTKYYLSPFVSFDEMSIDININKFNRRYNDYFPCTILKDRIPYKVFDDKHLPARNDNPEALFDIEAIMSQLREDEEE